MIFSFILILSLFKTFSQEKSSVFSPPLIKSEINYLEPEFFETLTKRISGWNASIANAKISIEDLKRNNNFKNDILEFRNFLKVILAELKLLDAKLIKNEKYSTNVPRLFKKYLKYFNTNKSNLEFLSDLANVDLKEYLIKQDYYAKKVENLILGLNIFDFDDNSLSLTYRERSSKFMMACSQMLINDSNEYFDYKMDDFINLYLKDKNIEPYNMSDINKYGIKLKRDYR